MQTGEGWQKQAAMLSKAAEAERRKGRPAARLGWDSVRTKAAAPWPSRAQRQPLWSAGCAET